ncbi:hypothetical protein [Fluviicola taffensis]|uniref:hypothetical protein n=1 Tax=Fluviicola taffensis TaxID=191579 RepID=UPI0031377FDB
MKTIFCLILLTSTSGYSQIDSHHKQIELDSIELIKIQLRIDSLKFQLDSLKSESKKTQVLIDTLKQENILLRELMKLYLEQINRKQEEALKEEE